MGIEITSSNALVKSPTVQDWQKAPVLSKLAEQPSTSATETQTNSDTGLLSNKASVLRYLEELGKAGEAHFKESKQLLMFDGYLVDVVNIPRIHLRSVTRYLLDSIDYWNKYAGIDPNTRIKVMGHNLRPMAFVQKPWEPKELIDKELVQGQLLFLNNLYDKLEMIERKRHPNRVNIVHGPNATGKSRVFEALFEGLENYSKTNNGALYTFNWAFDERQILGFGAKEQREDQPVKPEEVVFWIPAGKNSHPIFLLEKEERVALLNELEKAGKLPPDFNKDYIISGEISSLSRKIYKSLLRMYEGNVKKVLNHVHVVRLELSALNREGAVLIQPAVTPHAVLTPIYPNVDWGMVPGDIAQILRTSGLHEIEGDFAQANRGIVVFDDVFKDHNIDEYLHLLRGAEKSRQTIATSRNATGKKTIDEQFDMLLFGTANDSTLIAMSKNQEWESLKTRFIFIPLGFERCYRNVAQIFSPQLEQQLNQNPSKKRHIAPYVLDTFGLWLTMTYLFPIRNINYYNSLDIPASHKERLFPLAKNLSILEKALLYQGEDINSYETDPKKQNYKKEEKELLETHLSAIADEYNLGVGRHRFFFYEGSHGLSSRVGEEIFEEAINRDAKISNCFSVLELFDTIEGWIEHGFEFEERRKEFITSAQKVASEAHKKGGSAANLLPVFDTGIPDTKNLLNQVKEHTKRQIRYDVQKALNCIKDKEEQLQTLRKYIAHVRAYTSTSSKIIKPAYRHPPNQEGPNVEFMGKIEKMFFPSGHAEIEKFRKETKQKIGEWLEGDNANKDPLEHAEKIFSDLIEKMNAYDLELNKVRVKNFLTDLRIYYERDGKIDDHRVFELEPDRKDILLTALQNLKSKMGYCDKCIPKLVYFAFLY